MSPSSRLPGHLAAQLGRESAGELVRVLVALHDGAAAILGENLLAVYLTGSLAVGRGDQASDVDFLMVGRRPETSAEEAAIRLLHDSLPDRPERWAQRLQGSWASVEALRDPVGRHHAWLYVDNGSRVMEYSRHDDTWNARWVLRHAGIPLTGPSPSQLVPEMDPRALKAEAVEQADARARWILQEPGALLDGWAQPYVVLTYCRLVWTATFGTVTSKNDAAGWVSRDVAPAKYRDLIAASIRYRTRMFDPRTNRADPAYSQIAGEFADWATTEIRERAQRP